MAVFEKVQEIIVEELGKKYQVTLESTFEDLEADSLVVPSDFEIEDAFDIQIETEEGLSVGDLVTYVEKLNNNG
ncbi:MAG: acyl carrier protein [Streptococcus sp.]